MKNTDTLKPHLALIVANIMYGMNYSFYTSLIHQGISSDAIFFSRVLFSGIVFLPFLLITREFKISFKNLILIGIASLVAIYGRQYFMITGMNNSSPVDSSIIATTGPIMILIISSIWLKEKITGMKILGMCISLSGAAALILSNGTSGYNTAVMGNVMIFVSVIFGSFNNVYVKRLTAEIKYTKILGWYSVIGVIITAPFFWHSLDVVKISSFTSTTWIDFSYLIVLGTIIPILLLYYGINRLSPLYSGLYAYVQPVSATILAVGRYQDKLDFANVFSALFVFLGVFLVIRHNSSNPKNAINNVTG